jgi:4-amino-4-deoxy-L-arabinose transferase-like glycosyltransferase
VSRYRLPAAKGLLALIVAVYCILGVAYATETPKWQVPDEPAHYNYIVYLADTWRFPVLQMGDYPHEYLEKIKAARFPPDMSIAPLRYEFHQPPLYYVLAAALYKGAGFLGVEGQFLALRLFSVALGCILLLVAYATLKEIFPDSEFLALTATALVGTVPMHIAMSAAINNDTLAELVLAVLVWLCIRGLKRGLSWRHAVLLGLLLALALLTKTTIYLPSVLCIVLTLAVRASFQGRRLPVQQLGVIFGLGMLSCWWFIRNALTYGNLDLFGWQRHDSIVSGQPTTTQWIGRYGLSKVIHDFFVTSFHSFWAQFGWMGVLVDSRIYLLLGIVSIALGLGFMLSVARVLRDPQRLTAVQYWALALMLLIFVLVAAGHLWYNLKFVQHQGRYLFPALVPIGLAFALGLQEWASIAALLGSRLRGLKRVSGSLPSATKALAFSLFYAGFVALDLVCLYRFIVPYFRG